MADSELFPTQFSKEVYNEEVPPSMQKFAQQQQQQVALRHQEQNRHQIQNPFSQEQYGNIPIPDTPLNYGGGMVDALLGDQDVPELIKVPFWYVFIKDNVLGFVDKERKENLMLNFDIIKIDELNALPYYDYDFAAEKQWNILRNVYETKLNRAYGFKGQNVKNERIKISDTPKSFHIFVTHGIFSQGIDKLLYSGIDRVYTTDSFTSGEEHERLEIMKL